MSKRPDMRAYFRERIDNHVNGMMASGFSGGRSAIPNDVVNIDGLITKRLITVTMRDGTQWFWSAGKYSSRKTNGCYAPLMPRPVDCFDGPLEVSSVESYRRHHPDSEVVTCGVCNRSWDDSFASAWTPAPSARCPFEYDHAYCTP